MKRLFYTDEKTDNRIFSRVIGWQPSYGWLLLDEQTKYVTLFLDGRYSERAVVSSWWKVEKVLLNKKITDLLDWHVDTDEVVYIEKTMPRWVVDFLQSSEMSVAWTMDDKRRQQQQRISKTPEAIVATRQAITHTHMIRDRIETKAYAGELQGKTELQVRWMLVAKAYALWCSGESFATIVATGENSAIPHHETWDTLIADGPLLIDMWWIRKWWCSDFTRTIWIGDVDKKPPVAHSLRSWTTTPLTGGKSDHLSKDEFDKIVSIVRAAHDTAKSLVAPWVALKDVAAAARKVIDDAWYGENFTHSLGHGVWIDVHEAPGVHMKSIDVIQPWMIFTIEPWIYLPWKFGVRWENIVIVE